MEEEDCEEEEEVRRGRKGKGRGLEGVGGCIGGR